MSFVNIETQEDQEEFSILPGINILMFGSRHCGACRASKPHLLKMLNDYNFNLGHVEISNNNIKVKNLKAIPAFIVYKEGETPEFFEGFDKEYIEDFLV